MKSIWQFELKRHKALGVQEEDARIEGPQAARDLLVRLGVQAEDVEKFHVVLLGAKNEVRGLHVASVGTVCDCRLHCREVFRIAIIQGASRVLLAHNHPSGDPAPSAADVEVTRTLAAAGKIIGIEVVDHVIVGTPSPSRPTDWVSFRESNLL